MAIPIITRVVNTNSELEKKDTNIDLVNPFFNLTKRLVCIKSKIIKEITEEIK